MLRRFRLIVASLCALTACTSHPARVDAAPTDILTSGESGHAVYRIPAATCLASGRLLVFAEARASADDNGTNDIVLKHSDDGGATWGPLQLLLDEPGRSLNNPCVVQCTRGPHAGRVLLMMQSYPTGCGEGCVQPGNEGPRICRTLVMHSDDDGASWSAPRDVTASVKRAEPVTSVATGPGIGLQMQGGTHAGRVVMPFNQGPPNDWRVYAAYSDDGGDTWRMGDTAPEDGAGHANEVQMAERSDGSLLLVARQFGGGARRKRAVSTDGGVTWTRLAAVPDLPDPSCMGGLVNAQDSPGALLVCTGPSSERKRIAGRAWFSMDGGESWPRSVAVYGAGFAYSVPVRLGNGRVGVVFERDNYSRISFVELCDVPAMRAAVAHDVP